MKHILLASAMFLSMSATAQLSNNPLLHIPLEPMEVDSPAHDLAEKARKQAGISKATFYAGLLLTGMGVAVGEDAEPIIYLGGANLLISAIFVRSSASNSAKAIQLL